MSRIRYQVAMSLDGYIAGPDGEYDWIVEDPEVNRFLARLYEQFDTFLMGRRTFELMQKAGGPPMPAGSQTFVFSRTLPDDTPGAVVVREVTPDAVATIRAGAGKDIWLFGGGELFRAFLALGLVDTVEIAVIPVLIGGGLQMLPQPASKASLRLTGHTVYPSGIVLLEYEVEPVHPPAARSK